MKLRLMVVSLLLCVGGLVTTWSQIPRTLSYQGVLTDSLGIPKPDGTYSITFRLYDVPVGGSALWTEQKTLQVKRGLFSTSLGDQVVFGSALAFDTQYWLSIQVASGPELSPRIALTPVANSLRSVRADTASYALAAPGLSFVDSARIAGIVPNASITTLKIADSTITGSDISRNAALNITSLNASTNVGRAVVLRSGAGSTTSTVAALQGENFGTFGESAWLRTSSSSNGSPVVKLHKHPASTASFVEGLTWDGVGSATSVFSILGTGGAGFLGNVGIGTMAPSQRLDVVGGITVAPNGTTPDNGYNGNLVITKPPASGQYINLVRLGNIPWSIGTVYNSNTFAIGFGQASDPAFTSPYLAITNVGRLGVGTATPTAKLQVADGGGTVTGTSAGLNVEQFNMIGEAVWLRTSSSSNTSPVMKMHRHPSSTSNFIDGMNWNGVAGATRVFHITGAGTFVAGSDFAEAFEAVGGKQGFEPGDVVVLSTMGRQTVEKCSKPYDVRVAGIYSTRPGVLGADKDGVTRVDEHDIPIAIVGIVPTKVTAENGPISHGDLLTTSSTPGHGMKATPRLIEGIEFYPPGSILGKALEPLPDGTGVIKVLVTLR